MFHTLTMKFTSERESEREREIGNCIITVMLNKSSSTTTTTTTMTKKRLITGLKIRSKIRFHFFFTFKRQCYKGFCAQFHPLDRKRERETWEERLLYYQLKTLSLR